MNEGQLWMTIGADNTQFAKAANDTNKRLSDMSNNVKAFTSGIKSSFVEAAKQMAGFYSVAKAGSVFADLIQKNDAFNKSMREVSTLSDDVAKNLDSYKKQLLDMTTKIPIAADDAAKALYQINSAGHTGADGMMVLEASAKAAIGGVTDTATAADTITTVLNAYKMSSSQAAEVSDKLFTAVRLGKTTMSELGQSIAQVAPMAATYGISIDQVLAAVATLTKNGTPTAQAFTQIRAAIVGMSDAMGSTYFQTHTLQQAMIDLRAAVPDNNKLKDTMGRIEGVNAVLAMTGKNAAGAAADLKEFETSAGAAGDAYDKMNGGKGVELSKLQNNIMAEMAGLNNQISDTIAHIASALNEAFDSGAIDTFVDRLKEVIAVYGVYKGMAIAVTAAQSVNRGINNAVLAAEEAEISKLVALKTVEITADGNLENAEIGTADGRQANIIALRKEAAETLNNIRNKANEAAINLKNAQDSEAYAASRVAAAQQAIAMRQMEYDAAVKSGDGIRIENADIALNTAQLEENDAKRALKTAHEKTETAQIQANSTAKLRNIALQRVQNISDAESVASKGLVAKANNVLATSFMKLHAVMMANPWTMLAIGVTAAAAAIYAVTKNAYDSTAEFRGLDKAVKDTAADIKSQNEQVKVAVNKTVAEESAKLKQLEKTVKDTSKSYAERKKAIEDIKAVVPGYNALLDEEGRLTRNNTEAIDDYIAKLRAKAKAEAAHNMLVKNEEKIQKLVDQREDARTKLRNAQTNRRREGVGSGTNQKLKNTPIYGESGVQAYVASVDKDEEHYDAIENKLKKRIDSDNKQIDMLEKQNARLGKVEADNAEKTNEAANHVDIKNDKSTGKTAEQIAAEQAQAQADYLALLDKQKTERERKEQDMADSLVELDIKNIKDKNKRELAEMQFAHEKTILELDREEEDAIAHEVENQKALFDAQENKNAKGNDKYAKKVFTNADINQDRIRDIQSQYQARREKTFTSQDKEIDATRTAQAKAYAQELNEYLKQYGNYAQQKEAIQAEYAEKRKQLEMESPDDAAAQAQLAAEEQAALQKAAFDNIKQDLNWETVFANLDGYTTDFLEGLRQQLRQALDMKDISAENAKVITDQLDKITAKIGEMKSSLGNIFGEGKIMGGSWMGTVFQTVQKQNQLEEKAKADQETATKATGNAAQAQFQYQQQRDDFISQLSEKTGKSADEIGGMTTEQMGELAKQSGMTDAFSSVLQSGQGAAEAAQAAQAAQGASAASSASAAGGSGAAGLAVTDAIIHGVNQNVQSFSNMCQQWGIGSDDFQEKVAKFAESSQYATAAFDSLKQGDIAGVVFNLGEAVSSLGESFGIWSNSNAEEVKKENDRLENALKVNSEALDRNTKKISEGSAADSKKAYEQSQQVLELSSDEAQRKMLNNARFYDHGHSLQYDFNHEDSNIALVQKIGNKLGVRLNSLQDILSTDARTLEKLYDDEEGRNLLTEFTQALLDTQDSGNYNGMADDFLSYISTYGQDAFDSLTDSLYEAVTGVSFDGFKDNFVSMLMDLDSDVGDFADDFTKQITQSILNAQIEEEFGSEIESLQKAWGDALNNDNDINESEWEALQARQEDLTERMIARRDKIAEATGYDDVSSSEANGSINGISSISEDTANEIVGRLTAMQIGVEQNTTNISNAITQITIQTSMLTQSNAYLSDILNQHALTNTYLSDITKYSKAMYLELDGKMQKLVDQTSVL